MREIANIEMRYLSEELQKLAGARVEKIYELGESEFRFKLRIPGRYVDLTCYLKRTIHETKYVKEAPKSATQFAMVLRKHLENASVAKVYQFGVDRVLVFELQKESKLSLVFEMFSSGNLVLVGEDGKIISCYRREEWKDRKIARNETYVFPSSGRVNLADLNAEKLERILNEKYLIACLSGKVNLGALYLEEAIVRANLNPRVKANELEKDEIKALAGELKELFKTIEPRVYYGEEGNVVDYSLISLKKYETLEAKKFENVSEMLDEFYANAKEEVKSEGENALAKKREKLEKKLEEQTKHLEVLLEEMKSAKEEGNTIYAQYGKISALLERAQQMRKEKKGWDEIESELKKMEKGVVSLNKKEAKLVLEL
ncbi:MAG: NFACT family protein [Candidatus Micrarchaeota archaeon]